MIVSLSLPCSALPSFLLSFADVEDFLSHPEILKGRKVLELGAGENRDRVGPAAAAAEYLITKYRRRFVRSACLAVCGHVRNYRRRGRGFRPAERERRKELWCTVPLPYSSTLRSCFSVSGAADLRSCGQRLRISSSLGRRNARKEYPLPLPGAL